MTFAELPPPTVPWTADEAVVYLRMERLKHGRKMVIRARRQGLIPGTERRGREPLFFKSQLDSFLKIHGR